VKIDFSKVQPLNGGDPVPAVDEPTSEPENQVQAPSTKDTTPAKEPEANSNPQPQAPSEPQPDPIKDRFGMDAEQLEQKLQQLQDLQWLEEDPFFKKTMEQYRSGKSLNDIANVLGRNWNDASNEEVLREQLVRDGYVEKELQDYKIQEMLKGFSDDDDSVEAKLARKDFAKKADEYRKQLIQEQQDFGKPVDHNAKEVEQLKQQLEQWWNSIDSDPLTEQLEQTSRLELKYGDQTQNLEVDPETLKTFVKDPVSMIDAIGKMELPNHYEVAAFIANPEQFKKQLIEMGKLSVKQEILNEERNPEPKTPDPGPTPELASIHPKDMTPQQKAEFLRRVTLK